MPKVTMPTNSPHLNKVGFERSAFIIKALIQINPKGLFVARIVDVSTLVLEPYVVTLIPVFNGYAYMYKEFTLYSDNAKAEPDFHILMIKE